MGGIDYEAFYCEAGKVIGIKITNILIISNKLKICTFALLNK